MKIKNTLLGIVLSTSLFIGCREIPTTPEPEFKKEKISFSYKPKNINTKNGEFIIWYLGGKGGDFFNPSYGNLKIGDSSDSTIYDFEVNITDKNAIWFSKDGPTQEYYENSTSLLIRYLGKFICEAYLINPKDSL